MAAMQFPEYRGGRCMAADTMGNRCHKHAGHVGGVEVGSRRHDASRGDLQRFWS